MVIFIMNQTPRRQIIALGAWNTVQLDYRNPVTIVFWTIAYAGLGHIILDRYFRGIILLTGEIFLNTASHLNIAIFYTIIRRYDLAKQVIDTRWYILYLTVFSFAIFDAYRETIVINNTYRLAERENAPLKCFAINSSSFTILNSLSPYVVALWSAVLPGSGCFLIQRMNRALFLMILWVCSAYLSGLYPALILTLEGQFELAKSALNIQWYLNIPSILFYSIYESFSCALENNKLFRKELACFLKRDYQNELFPMTEVMKGI
jgi:hypothetical protein